MGGEGRESAGKDVDVERNLLCANEGCHEREGDEVERGIVTRWARRLFPGSVNLVSCFIIARSRNLLPTLVIAQSW